MSTAALMTADDLATLGPDARVELIEGVLTPMVPPDLDHIDITGLLIQRLRAFAEQHAPGIVGPEGSFRLRRDPDTVLLPDVAYVRADRVGPKGSRRGVADLAPDLAVEVVSPGNSVGEMNRKVLIYLEAGVRQVWVVDPASRTVTVYAPDGAARLLAPGDALDGGDALPGFALPVSDIFA